MVGKPDGLGAFDNYDGTFTLLDESRASARGRGNPPPRPHRRLRLALIIDSDTLEVRSGEDLARHGSGTVGDRGMGTDRAADEQALLGRPATTGCLLR